MAGTIQTRGATKPGGKPSIVVTQQGSIKPVVKTK